MAAGIPMLLTREPGAAPVGPRNDPAVVRWALIAIALGFLGLFLFVPLVAVFAEAFRKGAQFYLASFRDPATSSAIWMTLVAAGIAVPLNMVFGLAAAWAIARFRFPGRSVLTTLIDLPFTVSPVVSGLIFVLVFGSRGWLGPWLTAHHLHVIFAPAGIVLATTFVTFPFVARELIPLMEALGNEEELAAVSLGAGGWQVFWRVTLPNVKWGLLYGVILCNARAMGEFGAVSVVAGATKTITLHVDELYSGYNTAGAFAVASLLTLLALATLAVKTVVEHKSRAELAQSNQLRGGGRA